MATADRVTEPPGRDAPSTGLPASIPPPPRRPSSRVRPSTVRSTPLTSTSTSPRTVAPARPPTSTPSCPIAAAPHPATPAFTQSAHVPSQDAARRDGKQPSQSAGTGGTNFEGNNPETQHGKVMSSTEKRKVPSVPRAKAPDAKRFKSPMATAVGVRSTGVKVLLSPRSAPPMSSSPMATTAVQSPLSHADLWTSSQNLGYLCVTLHFIDEEWELHKKIITFASVETPHTGLNLFKAMLSTLQEWNMEERVFAITLDNALANDNFVHSLKCNLVAKSLLLHEGKLLHYRCGAHILNLIAQEGFKFLRGAIDNIRESVKYIRSSPSRKERFDVIMLRIGIPSMARPSLDVPTRWNSTYEMLMSAAPYQRVFEALAKEDPQYVYEPSIEEWKLSSKLCDMLKVFSVATKLLSGSEYPTIHLYFHQLWEVKKMLEKESFNSEGVIVSMVNVMKTKFKKYWDLSFVKICLPVVLDPRFKLGFLEFRLKKGFESMAATYLSKIEQMFHELFEEYSLKSGYLVSKNADSNNDEVISMEEEDPWADWGHVQNVQQTRTTNELEEYLGEETIPVKGSFDILGYWRAFSSKYPVLACLARDILAVPASTVASESAFSTGERVISDYKSSLTSKNVEVLICLQDWLRSTGSNEDNIAGNVMKDDGLQQ